MERRNYPVHGLGNGWERRKDESKTLSLYYRQPGTRDEDLLKVAELDLDKCVNAYRASELSKERNRAIEATSETVHHITRGNKREEKKDKRDQGGRDDKN